MEFKLHKEDDYIIVDVIGDIDFYDAPSFKDYFTSLLEESDSHLILDMAKVDQIDSSGIGAILSVYSKVVKNKKMLVLVSVSNHVKKILQFTNVSTFFPLLHSVKEAVEHIEEKMAK